jgi:hypothetical protein
MATMSAGDECTGSRTRRPTYARSGSAPSYGGCARPTPGRGATSPNLSAAEVCPATEVCTAATEVCTAAAEVCTATTEVCTATTDVCTATAMTAATVLRGSIGSKR